MDDEGSVATAELFRQHARFVVRFLIRYGVERGSIDDLVQDVFLVVHRHGGYTPGPAKPSSWLAAIAIRVATTHRRKVELRTRSVAADADVDDSAGACPNPEARYDLDAQTHRMLATLKMLSPEHRSAFILFELEGESCASIAAAMDVPIGTIHSRLHVARRKLRDAVLEAPARTPDAAVAPMETRHV